MQHTNYDPKSTKQSKEQKKNESEANSRSYLQTARHTGQFVLVFVFGWGGRQDVHPASSYIGVSMIRVYVVMRFPRMISRAQIHVQISIFVLRMGFVYGEWCQVSLRKNNQNG